MLEPNRLDPPRPFCDPIASSGGPRPPLDGALVFVSPEDFDATGILAGFDPCASNYWWMPELHLADATDAAFTAAPMIAAGTHATRRTTSRSQAAA